MPIVVYDNNHVYTDFGWCIVKYTLFPDGTWVKDYEPLPF